MPVLYIKFYKGKVGNCFLNLDLFSLSMANPVDPFDSFSIPVSILKDNQMAYNR